MLSTILSAMKQRFHPCGGVLDVDFEIDPRTECMAGFASPIQASGIHPGGVVEKIQVTVPTDVGVDEHLLDIDTDDDSLSSSNLAGEDIDDDSDATSGAGASAQDEKGVVLEARSRPTSPDQPLFKEVWELQNFLRVVNKRRPPTSDCDRFAIFADNFMWGADRQRMENTCMALDLLEETIKKSPYPVSMIRSYWKQNFMRLFSLFGGIETHCIVLTSGSISPDIHADILDLARSLPPRQRTLFFSRLKFHFIQIVDDLEDPAVLDSLNLVDKFHDSLAGCDVQDVAVTSDIVYARIFGWHPVRIANEVFSKLIPDHTILSQ